jgi:transglutaminase-like putative cysteine protease
MTRGGRIAAGAFVAALAALAAPHALSDDAGTLAPGEARSALGERGPAKRRVRFEYAFEVEPPAGAKRLEVWFPIPQESPFQTVEDLALSGRGVSVAKSPKTGMRAAHALVEDPGATRFSYSVAAVVTRYERLNRNFRTRAKELSADERLAFASLLLPNALVPIAGPIEKFAPEKLRDAEEPGGLTILNSARRFYDVILEEISYRKDGTGWGRGDVAWVCDNKYGNCSDFHSVFMALCRRRGIPAAFAIGVSIPAARGEGTIGGYHCWAEFYAPDAGWIPVDISEASKDPALREYYFGGQTEDRIELSFGRDVVLEPPQKAPPLNFFFKPHVEVDGAPIEDPVPAIGYKDVP